MATNDDTGVPAATRRFGTRWVGAVATVVLIVAGAGCASDAQPRAGEPGADPGAAAADGPAILAAAARSRVQADNGFGGTVAFAEVLIVDQLVAPPDADDPSTPTAPVRALTAEERAAVEAALTGETLRWVGASAEGRPTLDAAGGADPPRIVAILQLAVPERWGEEAHVFSSLECGSLCAIGGTHVVERSTAGGWVVTGTTGSMFMS